MNDTENDKVVHIDASLLEGFDEEEVRELENLYSAVLSLKDVNEVHKFFLDLCSSNEICSFLRRWQILLRIHNNCSYESIIEDLAPRVEDNDNQTKDVGRNVSSAVKRKMRSEAKVSSATISRVKNCYKREGSGYRIALDRLGDKAKLDLINPKIKNKN